MPTLTLIVPCYNEAARLDVGAFANFASLAGPSAGTKIEFLFVNDGSTDATADVLRSLVASMPDRARLLDLSPNGGKAEAVRRGMIEALTEKQRPDYVGYWDADLATPLGELARFVEVLDANPKVDFVLGSRVKLMGRTIERKPARHYLGRVFATAASSVLQLPIYDTQCGAKVLRVHNWTLDLFADRFLAAWIFDVELLARFVSRAPAAEHAIYELPLRTWVDIAGSKVRPRDFVRSAADLFAIRRKYGRK